MQPRAVFIIIVERCFPKVFLIAVDSFVYTCFCCRCFGVGPGGLFGFGGGGGGSGGDGGDGSVPHSDAFTICHIYFCCR